MRRKKYVPAEPNQVSILGQSAPYFGPNNLTVRAGETVTFKNDDFVLHTVTSTSSADDPTPDGVFDTGLLNGSESAQVTFDEPGTYNYFCSIPPDERSSHRNRVTSPLFFFLHSRIFENFIASDCKSLAMSLSYNDRLALLQHAISKYDSESVLKEKLKGVMSDKDIERGIDTLIATQKVRRIGPDVIQNNESAAGELPELSDDLKELVEKLGA